ncbi:MAG: hypothetical protein LC715_00725 [Gammaproteobacteria bacterium]|nr:hypothetical protein [Gammaproteobacteria bacterium]
MRLHAQTTNARRGNGCAIDPYLAALCAVMLATLSAGCERDAGPGATSSAGQAPGAQDVVPEAADPSRPAPVPAPNPDAPPRPVAGTDQPKPTIAPSAADSTRSGGDIPILRAVRVGQQPGADRLVFEFDGAGLPAWRVEYVDRPVRDCGSGDTVPVAGDAWLQIRFSGANAHTEAGEGTSGPRRRAVNLPVLRELVRTCDFEAEVIWVAGVGSPNRYTPRVLADPSRLVIDIAR